MLLGLEGNHYRERRQLSPGLCHELPSVYSLSQAVCA